MAVIGLLVAVLTFLFTKKDPRLSDTNQRLSCYTYYFDASQSAIDEAIRNRRFEHLKSLINIHDAGIRLDMLCTDDATIARYRLYKYIPFEYQPISEITELDPTTATALKTL